MVEVHEPSAVQTLLSQAEVDVVEYVKARRIKFAHRYCYCTSSNVLLEKMYAPKLRA